MKKVFSSGRSEEWPLSVIVHTDGASRGNPGVASIGVSVSSEALEVIYEYGAFLGETTNNYAEYMALYKALDLCVKNKVERLILYSDSQLVVEQMVGNYRVKSPLLRRIYEKCRKLSAKIPFFSLKHVRREENQRADKLANRALDLEQFT